MATIFPKYCSTTFKDKSIPDETPADVYTVSKVYLLLITLVEGLISLRRFSALQCVVAFLFFKRPAVAYKREPVHTDNIKSNSFLLLIHDITSLFPKSFLVPFPPGSSKISIRGVLIKL